MIFCPKRIVSATNREKVVREGMKGSKLGWRGPDDKLQSFQHHQASLSWLVRLWDRGPEQDKVSVRLTGDPRVADDAPRRASGETILIPCTVERSNENIGWEGTGAGRRRDRSIRWYLVFDGDWRHLTRRQRRVPKDGGVNGGGTSCAHSAVDDIMFARIQDSQGWTKTNYYMETTRREEWEQTLQDRGSLRE